MRRKEMGVIMVVLGTIWMSGCEVIDDSFNQDSNNNSNSNSVVIIESSTEVVSKRLAEDTFTNVSKKVSVKTAGE